MKTFKKLTALLLAIMTLFSLASPVFALPVEDEEPMEETLSTEEYHDALAMRKQIATMQLVDSSSIISNDYLEFYVDDSDSDESGRFTIGNTGGNPNYTSDDGKILLYGHPSPWSSYTTIRIDGQDYFFIADDNKYDPEEKIAVSTMTINGNIVVTQTLQFVVNQGTGLEDSVKISYDVENNSGTSHAIGIRIMMDTMLGYNDGAPFKVPAVGNITSEREMAGNAVPQFWQAFDSLEDPSVFAVGTLYKDGDRKPDRVMFTNWGNVYSSDAQWVYQIDPYQTVTGDSAISIYWNPITVGSNGSTSVCTYYGVGYVVSEEDALIGSADVAAGGFGIQIVGEDNQPIAGVSVTAQNISTPTTVVTNEEGIASFPTFPGNGALNISFKLEKEGYCSSVVERRLEKDGLTCATLYKDDGKIKFLSAMATLDGSSFDLLSNYRYFKENAQGATAAEDNSNVKNLVIKVDTISSTSISKYQILQGGEVKYESSTSTFTIPVFTGTATDPDKFGTDWRIDKLDSGKVVYLRAIDADGNVSDSKVLGIKVSMPTTYGMTETKGTMSFGEKLKINLPSDIPILGDTEIELGWDGLPFVFEISDDGKVKFAINPKYEDSNGTVNWYNVGKDYEDAMLSAVEGRTSAKNRGYGGTPQKFGAGKVEVSADFMGYGEGYVDEYGNIIVNVGLVVTISEEASYTWTFFLGYVPVYISVGEKVSLTCSGQFSVTIADGDISISGAAGELNPKITLNVDGGVGANGVLSIGASGRATLSWLYRWSDSYNRVDLTGGMYIVAKAFLFKAEKKLAEGTWTIYDSYSRAAQASILSTTADFYNEDSYSLMDRDYLYLPTPFAQQTGVVKYGVYPNATPQLVQVGDSAYLFWLEDIADRASADRSALVYVRSDDGFATWSDPVALFEENENSTADYSFDVCASGEEIHIALCKANTVFGDAEVTLETMAAASEVYYLKLDTASGAVSSVRVTDDSFANTMPAISVQNGEIVLSYVENRMEEGFFGTANTQSVAYVLMDTTPIVQTMSVNGLVSALSVGELDGQTVVAYVLDTDSDYNTDADTQLWIFDGVSNHQLSGSGCGVASPAFAQLNGEDTLLWYEAGNILYTHGTAIETVFTDSIPTTLSRSFYVLSAEDQSRIVWEAVSDDEYRTDTNVYAVSYQNGSWTPVFQMMQTESELTSTFSGYIADGNAYVAYLKTMGVAEDYPVSSLCVAQVEPDANISLTGVDWDKDAVKPGDALPLTITVQNIGSLDVDTFDVSIGSDCVVTVEDAALKSGETKSFTVDGFVIPAELSGPTTFEVQVSCEGDYDNTAVPFTIGYCDIAVSAESMLVNDRDCVSIAVSNNSNIPSDVTLRIISDTADGAVLYQQFIPGLTAGASSTILVDLVQICGNMDVDKFFIQATSSVEDAVPTNNTQMLYTAVGKEKTYTLSIAYSDGGTVTGEAGGNYPAGQEITVTAEAYPKYKFTGWASSSDNVVFADANAETTTFVMPEEDVSVWANFEDISINVYPDSTSLDLELGQTYLPEVSFSKDAEGLLDSLIWTSSNTDVVTVDETGLITAVGRGYATITITSTNELVNSTQIEVYVYGINIWLDSTSLSLEIGQTHLPEVSFSKDAEGLLESLIWTSSDTNVATVDETGLITAVGRGYATISITSTNELVTPTEINVYVYGSVIHEVTDPAQLESAHPYENSADDIWVYTLPYADSLVLKFSEDTVTESGYDYITISNGEFEEVGTYSGSELAGAEITVPGDTVRIRLTTDGSVTKWGFKVDSITFTNPDPTIVRQPESVCVEYGTTASVSVEVDGDGLTYQWYYANKDSDTFSLTTTFTGDTYSVSMNNGRAGRRVYCVITDAFGRSVQTDTVTLSQAARITTQPKTTYTKSGSTAKVTVKATGDDLTYQWYVKNAGASKFSKSSVTSATYGTKMSSASKDRAIYCVITDKHGNSVKTNTVYLRMAATVTTQPKTTYTKSGSTAKVTVEAAGDGLTYQWYYKNAGATKFSKSSVTSSTYATKMNSSSKNRQVYCVVTDKYGNTVKTNTVYLRMAATVTTQPKTTYTKSGSTAKVTVKAVGDGLTYQWYVKNAGATKFSKSSVTSATYATKMSSSSKNRQVYCVITDKYGNTVKTNTVYLRMAATVTSQPTNVSVEAGAKATVTVKAVGDGLTYKWYYAEKGSSTFKLTTSFTGTTYSVTMNSARDGRRVYCVITDKYGNTVKTNTVTLSMK